MKLKRGYKLTEVGVIPDDWEIRPVREAYTMCNNLRLPISHEIRKRMPGEYPYYGPTRVQDYINTYRVEGEYVLIGEDGDHFLKWKEISMTLLVSGKFNVNNHVHLVIGLTNSTCWFYYYFQHRDITSYLTRQGAGRYKLTKNALMSIPCPLPPVEEQKAITKVLSDIDTLLIALDALIAKKRLIKQGAMQELLTGKTRLQGFTKKWESHKLGEIARIQKGQLITEKTAIPGNVPVIAGGKQPAYYHNKPNRIGKTITISASGANAGYIAFFYLPIFASDCSTIVESTNYSIEYIYQQLLLHQEDIYMLQTGGAQPHIHPNDLEPIEIWFPEKEEQQAISVVLFDLDAEISALEQQRDKTRLLKHGMMQELLAGRIRLV